MTKFRSQAGFLNAQGAPLYYEIAGQDRWEFKWQLVQLLETRG